MDEAFSHAGINVPALLAALNIEFDLDMHLLVCLHWTTGNKVLRSVKNHLTMKDIFNETKVGVVEVATLSTSPHEKTIFDCMAATKEIVCAPHLKREIVQALILAGKII